jgi:hypothetical protein
MGAVVSTAEPRATVAGGRDPLGGNLEANCAYHNIVRSHAAEAARVAVTPVPLPTEHVLAGAVLYELAGAAGLCR